MNNDFQTQRRRRFVGLKIFSLLIDLINCLTKKKRMEKKEKGNKISADITG
jgi:hypothetical protein